MTHDFRGFSCVQLTQLLLGLCKEEYHGRQLGVEKNSHLLMVKNKERERERAWGPYNPSKGMPLMTFHEMPPLKCLNSLQSGDQAFKAWAFEET